MPERFPVLPPIGSKAKQNVIAGTNTFSGTPNTGQVLFTFGPSMTDSSHSGAPGDVNLWVGAGRLDFIQLLGYAAAAPAAASGLPIYFYDSAAVVSGGPIQNSGLNVVGMLDARADAVRSFGNTGYWNSGAVIYTGLPMTPGTTFTSGLCVHTKSGQPGWIAGWTPVISGGGF